MPPVGGTDTESTQSEVSRSHGEVTGLCAELRPVADEQLPLQVFSLFSVTFWRGSPYGDGTRRVVLVGLPHPRGVQTPHPCSAALHVTLVWRVLSTCHGAGE